jgi:hypothetical protein
LKQQASENKNYLSKTSMLATTDGIPAFDSIKSGYTYPNKKVHVRMSLHYP